MHIKYLYNPLLTLAKLIKYNSIGILPSYFTRRVAGNNSSNFSDLILLIADHFEPSRSKGKDGIREVATWCDNYKSAALQFVDSDGCHPKHTWFYRYDYPCEECIHIINQLTFIGLGEIEFHLHHGNDNSENFSKTIHNGLNWFNSFGAMIGYTNKGLERNFGYVAGNWALDNGAGDDSLSGVNDEISILAKFGCYADFTFPAFGSKAQGKMINSIYYASDTGKPKSYNIGKPLQVDDKSTGDLLIIQGPVYFDWKNSYIEYAALEQFAPHKKNRLQYWTKACVSVAGREEWRIVKLHTHGIQSSGEFTEKKLVKHYSDIISFCKKRKVRLHFVTARECYNIAMAAKDGLSGNPNNYRDYIIPKPLNVTTNNPKRYNVSEEINGQYILTSTLSSS